MATLGSLLAHRVVRRLGERTVLHGWPFIMALILAAALAPAGAGILLLALLSLCSSSFRPLLSTLVNRLIPSEQRATILSLQSLLFTLLLAASEPLLGWLGDAQGLGAVLAAQATAVALLGGLLLAAGAGRAVQGGAAAGLEGR